MLRLARHLLLPFALLPFALGAQTTDSAHVPRSTPACESCAAWNAPHRPVHILGNTYYVGTDGLASILITSDRGHVLIDGGLAESAPRILANIQALGFRIEDVKLIVTSHVHYDHVGGVAELQRRSGAEVAASPSSADVLRTGVPGRDDPQHSIALPIAPVARVRVIADGETLHVGPIAVTAHFTPGHTSGGTTWTWRSCEAGQCEDMVYADSQTPVSADDFLFTRNNTYPNVLQDFEKSFAVLDGLPCGILLTPHPGASDLWKRLAARDSGNARALVDASACHSYAAHAREQLATRVAAERAKP